MEDPIGVGLYTDPNCRKTDYWPPILDRMKTGSFGERCTLAAQLFNSEEGAFSYELANEAKRQGKSEAEVMAAGQTTVSWFDSKLRDASQPCLLGKKTLNPLSILFANP